MKEKQLKIICQDIIDSALDSIVKDSEDWGLGEMYELETLDSIDKIVVTNVTSHTRITIYVDIYLKTKEEDQYDYYDIMSELRYRVESRWIPNSFIVLVNVFPKY